MYRCLAYSTLDGSNIWCWYRYKCSYTATHWHFNATTKPCTVESKFGVQERQCAVQAAGGAALGAERPIGSDPDGGGALLHALLNLSVVVALLLESLVQ
jgi:hypothetical protein